MRAWFTSTQRDASLLCVVVDRRRLFWKYRHCSGVWFCLALYSADRFLSALTVSVHLSRTQIKLTTNPNSPTVYSFRRAVFNLCTFCPYLLFQYQRNQRNQGPLWWRLGAALLSLLFDRGFVAGGGGAGRRWGEGGGVSSSTFFASLWNGTLKGTVKSNTGFWERKTKRDKKSPRAETTKFYTRSCVSLFQRRCHDAPQFLYRTMFLFWYTCGVVVLYSTLFSFNFLHFRHVSISHDLHWPWECLILCILPEWVLRNLRRKGEMFKKSLGDQTGSKSPKRQLLRAKRFAPKWNHQFSLFARPPHPPFTKRSLVWTHPSVSVFQQHKSEDQTCPVVLGQSLLGLCATYQTEQASGSRVNIKPLTGGKVF